LASHKKKTESEVDKLLEINGRKIQLKARQRAPKDLGGLGQSIHVEFPKRQAVISANVFYAPYQEFGTGGEVSIPKGFEELAKVFHTGNGRINIRPQPFLIPSYEEGKVQFMKDLKKYLDEVRW
jgi:HK97 gp10 family phage protein